jgi:hypothetical protein
VESVVVDTSNRADGILLQSTIAVNDQRDDTYGDLPLMTPNAFRKRSNLY